MKSSVEKQGQFEHKISIEIAAEEIENKIVTRLNELAKKMKAPGFRPGKVPMKLVQGRYGNSVRQEVVEAEVNQSLFKAIEEAKLMPANTPHVHMEQNQAGETLKFYAHFEIFPEIKLADVKSIQLDVPVAVINDKDLADVLGRIQKSHSQWQTCGDPAANGHRITVNFKGVLVGETKPFTEDKDVKIILGDNRMIPGFEDELLGLKIGDQKQFTITFPEKYVEQLANKRAEFTVDILNIETGTLPEITDAFCQDILGMNDGTVAQLKEKITENLQHEANEKVRRDIHKKLLKELSAINPIEVPPSLVKNELKVLKENINDPRLPQEVRESEENAHAEAVRRVSYSLLLGQYIREHNIQVDQKRVQQTVMNMARNSQDPEGMLRWFFEDKKRLTPVSSLVLEEQALDQLLQEISRNEVQIPYQQIMATDEAN